MSSLRFRALFSILCISFLFLLIGCQSVLSNPSAVASPSPTPTTPSALKQPKFLFVGGQVPGGGAYEVFAVDAATGELTALPGKTPDENVAKEILFEPGSSTLYASTGESELMDLPGLHVFHFNSPDGSLTAVNQINNFGDWSSVASPDGTSLYINGFQSLSQFSVDKNSGALTQSPLSPYPTDSLGQWMLRMHPSGRFIYGTGLYPLNPPGPNGSNSVYHLIGFSLDPSSGTPVALSGFPHPEHLNGGVAIHSSGNFIVAAGANVIYSYRLDPTTGSVQLAGTTPFDGQNFPLLSPVIDPSGRYVYLCCANNQLFAFRIMLPSGQLVPLPSSPIAVTQPDNDPEIPIAVSGSYLFLGQGRVLGPDLPSIAVFKIQDNGSLVPVPGSPFPETAGFVKSLAVAEQ